MADVTPVQIVEGTKALVHQQACLLLSELVALEHVGEEVSSLAVVGDDE